MEKANPEPVPTWSCPAWLEARLVADARFARAYDAIGDQRRALLKGLIATHFALIPPTAALCAQHAERLACGLTVHTSRKPRPFVLLLADAAFDAPALLLAALMPVLCSGAADVLVARLGSRASLPDVLLTACELAGQERVAALGSTLAAQLLAECAQSGLPGLVLHPDTTELRRILHRPALRAVLDASPLRLVPLRVPQDLGLWRDAATQFDPEQVRFLYGDLVFDTGGPRPGRGARKAPDQSAFNAFVAARRELLLLPDARVGGASNAARLVVGEALTGLWTWPELPRELFTVTTQACASAPETL